MWCASNDSVQPASLTTSLVLMSQIRKRFEGPLFSIELGEESKGSYCHYQDDN